MARIVLGLGASHGAPTNVPASQWPIWADLDKNRSTFDYEEQLRRVRPGIEQEITPEKMEERYQAGQRAQALLNEKVGEVRPDVLVIFGDDQREQFLDDNMPMFCIFRGEEMPTRRRREGADGRPSQRGSFPSAAVPTGGPERYQAVPALAEHLIAHLVGEGFDIACSKELKPEVGLGHAFHKVCIAMPELGNIPMVPVMVNTYYPPNQPRPRRCYALGSGVRDALESWESDARVAVMASGGLSHQIIDEELDRTALDAMLEKDVERLCTLPVEKLVGGTSEILNWVAVAGALDPLAMTLVDYIPAYRSPAGTGCAMGFAYWT